MLMPKEAIAKVMHAEIDSVPHLIARLKGERPYPVEVPLKLPTAKQILQDTLAFENFVNAWRDFPHRQFVQSVGVNYRIGLQGEDLPERLSLPDLDALLEVIPKKAAETVLEVCRRVRDLAGVMHVTEITGLYDLYRDLHPEALTDLEFADLLKVLPQLHRGCGRNLYLRALPLVGIDTKFLERHHALIEEILKLCKLAGDEEMLEEYLEVIPKPDGFAHLRILDKRLVERYSYMTVPSDELILHEPPGSRLLVVENVQSGLMLGELEDTSVVFGCGKNLTFAGASWLKRKQRIVYWGDLDSWGLSMLADFRRISGIAVDSALMDLDTIVHAGHEGRMVVEPKSTLPDRKHLRLHEIAALDYLVAHPERNRLEQEKLDQDLVGRKIREALAL